MATKARVLVMGATGQVGGALLPLLSEKSDVEVIAAVRNQAKAAHLSVPTVHLDLDDFTTFAPALRGIDRIFMATGYTVDMLRQSKDLVNCAKRAGVQQIVHLGACGDNDTRVPHYGWHQFIERYIEWSGITFTHLRPEIFMQNLLGYGGESYVKQGVIKHYVGAAKLSWVDCGDVAAVAAECLADPAKHAGMTYRMGYEAKTYYDLAQTFTEVLGQRFTYEPQSPAEFLRNVLAAGAEPAYMKCVFDSYTDFTNGVDIGADEVFDNLPSLIGRNPSTLADFANKHAERFRY
ncbi:SDR family oxidoreductase [Granulicella sibirica]|uniref:Oxidoreductase n=1 Tax=Granulicella sibirica TaxID=2479048 RepID=A0A4Q0T3K0_9BACT|nr:SDR family oxidoreductase [Granulicella sibirica]RXH58183.1 Oxidoreductase [Granulicella sibirica]